MSTFIVFHATMPPNNPIAINAQHIISVRPFPESAKYAEGKQCVVKLAPDGVDYVVFGNFYEVMRLVNAAVGTGVDMNPPPAQRGET